MDQLVSFETVCNIDLDINEPKHAVWTSKVECWLRINAPELSFLSLLHVKRVRVQWPAQLICLTSH